MSDTYDLMPTPDNRQWKLSEPEAPTSGMRPAAFTPSEDTGSDIFQPLRVLYKRRLWIYISTVLAIILAAVVCVVVPPTYVATSRLQLLNQSTGSLAVSNGAPGSDGDGFDFFAT